MNKHISIGISVIAILLMFVLIIFSAEIAEHRIQALFVAIGPALAVEGYIICSKKSHTFSYRNKASGRKKSFNFTGRKAQRIGVVLIIAGILLCVWSLSFWVRYVATLISV